MAEENHQKVEAATTTNTSAVGDGGVEAEDLDFLGKKEEEKVQGELTATGFGEKVKVSETRHESGEHNEEEEKEKKHVDLLEKISTRSSSSSSGSSSDEECEEEERKKKKREKKKKKKQNQHEEDGTIPVERVDVEEEVPEEKKGFLDKIMEKLPGQSKMTDEPPPPPPPSTEFAHEGGDAKEKKGFLDKIKEKLPGYHAKTAEGSEK